MYISIVQYWHFCKLIVSGGQWSEEAITCFENLTHCAQWKVLSAEMVKYDVDSKGRQRPLLKLIDKSQGHVSVYLVQIDLRMKLRNIYCMR